MATTRLVPACRACKVYPSSLTRRVCFWVGILVVKYHIHMYVSFRSLLFVAWPHRYLQVSCETMERRRAVFSPWLLMLPPALDWKFH